MVHESHQIACFTWQYAGPCALTASATTMLISASALLAVYCQMYRHQSSLENKSVPGSAPLALAPWLQVWTAGGLCPFRRSNTWATCTNCAGHPPGNSIHSFLGHQHCLCMLFGCSSAVPSPQVVYVGCTLHVVCALHAAGILYESSCLVGCQLVMLYMRAPQNHAP